MSPREEKHWTFPDHIAKDGTGVWMAEEEALPMAKRDNDRVGAFTGDETFRTAYEVYLDYYHRTEMFDQLTCRARSPYKGHALPVESHERHACMENARSMRVKVELELDRLEVPREIREQADRAASEAHERRYYSIPPRVE